jgi:hypothetical protein
LAIACFASEALVGFLKPSLHGRAGTFVLGGADWSFVWASKQLV